MPIIKPAKPIPAIKTFFAIKTALDNPDVECHRVQNSRNAGIVNPNVDNVSAPINDIKSSKFGIATASRTETKEKFCNIFDCVNFHAVNELTRYKNNCRSENIFPN